MAKRRKTREQKKLADLRHSFVHSAQSITKFEAKNLSISSIKVPSIEKVSNTVSLEPYPYLVKDLSKTGLLTLTILALQIVLFYLFKNHILIIPGINY